MANNSKNIKTTSDRFSYGLTIVILGVIYLFDKMGFLDQLPYGEHLMNVGVFFLIGGLVFLFTQPKKILGWIFLGVGLLLNADWFFGWMQDYSRLIVPIGLIIAGAAMVLTSRK